MADPQPRTIRHKMSKRAENQVVS